MHVLTAKDAKNISKELGPDSTKLYKYYVRVANTFEAAMELTYIANTLQWNIDRVRLVRYGLVSEGYLVKQG